MALTEDEVAQINRTGEQFKKTLKDVFEKIPRSAHSISGLARWSGINKSTCQRVVQSLQKSSNGIDVIVSLPGISAMQQFSRLMAKRLTDEQQVKLLEKVALQYEELILHYAPSQSQLKKLLSRFQSKDPSSVEAFNRKLRKQAYEINREISGESVETYLGVHYFRQTPGAPNYIDELIVSSRQGIQLTKDARPFVQSFAGNFNPINIGQPIIINTHNRNEFNDRKSGEYLLQDFSSPEVEASFAGMGKLKNSLIFDHNQAPMNGSQFDICIAHFDHKTQENPKKSQQKTICQSLLQRSPAKRLVLIGMIENCLDSTINVQTGCYPSSIKIHEQGHHPEDLWSERFSNAPEIKLVAPGETNLVDRVGLAGIDAVVQAGFDLLGVDGDDYRGYLIDVDYPMWLTSHRFYYEFS